MRMTWLVIGNQYGGCFIRFMMVSHLLETSIRTVSIQNEETSNAILSLSTRWWWSSHEVGLGWREEQGTSRKAFLSHDILCCFQSWITHWEGHYPIKFSDVEMTKDQVNLLNSTPCDDQIGVIIDKCSGVTATKVTRKCIDMCKDFEWSSSSKENQNLQWSHYIHCHD